MLYNNLTLSVHHFKFVYKYTRHFHIILTCKNGTNLTYGNPIFKKNNCWRRNPRIPSRGARAEKGASKQAYCCYVDINVVSSRNGRNFHSKCQGQLGISCRKGELLRSHCRHAFANRTPVKCLNHFEVHVIVLIISKLKDCVERHFKRQWRPTLLVLTWASPINDVCIIFTDRCKITILSIV